jgi:hypothetical protein
MQVKQTTSGFRGAYREFIIFILLTASISACTRHEPIENTVLNEAMIECYENLSAAKGKKAPAAHIAASEKVAIPEAISVPANLPAGNSRVATYYATGVQKYKARIKAGSNPVAFEWFFVAPEADLYDDKNRKVGTHGAGPFWELSTMDSIFAQHFTPAKTAASPDADNIDWLLLMPKTGTTPTGIFADVDYIQRITTKGGKAPVTPPARLDDAIEVKYQAVYRFTKKNN